MEDQDITLKLPKLATPPQQGVTDSQIQNMFAAGAGAFADQPTSPTRPWQPPTLEQLQQALPQYEITAFIARGGMGAVYKGTQKTLKRPVAINVMPPEMEEGDMQFTARFKHEAQAMAQLSHPNIVAVFDAGEVVFVEKGRLGEEETGKAGATLLYFVMEFVEGTDLAQLIASEGRIEPQRAIQITSAVCEALAFAHEEGIVHRDIKPSNIMIDKRGRVKVADFGLAKAFTLESTLISRSDVAMGTPDFIAPEAMVPGMKVDGRADLYAVGVMLYQMLTGKIPRGRFGLPSSVIPQMDKGFDAIVDKAMQTDRENRYSTATEMRKDVERVFQIVPFEGTGRTSWKTRSTSRKPLLLSAGAVILAAGTFVALKQPQDTGPSKATSAAAPKSKTVPQRTEEYSPAQIVSPPKQTSAPFSLEQWHQLFPVEKPDVWERLSSYGDGLLYVKSAGGFRKPMPSADGTIRAVVHIKTAKDTPTLLGRLSLGGAFYHAVWDVEHAVLFLAYYANPTGTDNGYEHLCSRSIPPDMTMKVGDIVKLEFRLEGDHLTALTNDKLLLDFHHDKLKTAGAWGIKSNTGAWFESAEIEPMESPSDLPKN